MHCSNRTVLDHANPSLGAVTLNIRYKLDLSLFTVFGFTHSSKLYHDNSSPSCGPRNTDRILRSRCPKIHNTTAKPTQKTPTSSSAAAPQSSNPTTLSAKSIYVNYTCRSQAYVSKHPSTHRNAPDLMAKATPTLALTAPRS
jgi:hypothetical protein